MTGIKMIQSTNFSHILFMFILGALTGLIYLMLTPVWWLMGLAAAITIAIFINNRMGVFIILTTLFMLNWLFGFFRAIPKELTWLPDIIILILAVKILYLQAKKNNWKSTPIDMFLLAIIALGILSAIYNDVSKVTILFGFRKFFKYTLLFLILRNLELESKFYRFFLIALLILALVQIPATIVQAIIFGTNGNDIADNVCGTLGGKATGAMALFMGFVISMMVGFYTQYKKLIFLLLCFMFLIPIMLGSGQFGFIVAPIAAIICWIFGHRLTVKNLLKIPLMIAMFIMFIIPVINYHDARYRGNLLDFIKSPEQIYALNIETRKEGTFGRFQVIDVAHQLLFESFPQTIIGFGPGNASESYFSEYSGQLEKKFRGAKIWGVQYTATVLEYGFLGVLLFLMMFFKLWRVSRRLYYKTESKFWKAISVGFSGILFVYIAGCLYNPVWYYDVLAFSFWFVSAALVVQLDNENNNEALEASR